MADRELINLVNTGAPANNRNVEFPPPAPWLPQNVIGYMPRASVGNAQSNYGVINAGPSGGAKYGIREGQWEALPVPWFTGLLYRIVAVDVTGGAGKNGLRCLIGWQPPLDSIWNMVPGASPESPVDTPLSWGRPGPQTVEWQGDTSDIAMPLQFDFTSGFGGLEYNRVRWNNPMTGNNIPPYSAEFTFGTFSGNDFAPGKEVSIVWNIMGITRHLGMNLDALDTHTYLDGFNVIWEPGFTFP